MRVQGEVGKYVILYMYSGYLMMMPGYIFFKMREIMDIKNIGIKILHAGCIISIIMFLAVVIIEVCFPKVYSREILSYAGSFFQWAIVFWTIRAAILLYR